MHEIGTDGAEYSSGFKQPTDGWHTVEVQEGIGFLKSGKAGEDQHDWQDKDGTKAYKFTLKIIDDDDNKDITIDRIANTKNGGKIVADLLAAAGLWKKLCEAYPGGNVSVFDKPIIEGIISKLPNTKFTVETEQNKEGKAFVKTIASFAKQKELIAARTSGDKGKKETKKESAAEAPTGW